MKAFGILLLFHGLLLFSFHSLAAFKPPPLRGPINDYANILNESTERQLGQALRSLKKQAGGTELAVLTLPTLEGLSIEQASFAVVDSWGLGGSKKDNGVLLLIAQKERRIRIEVGQGFEGQLTDAYAKRIVDESMVPLMRSGDPNGSVLVGVLQIVQRIHPKMDMKPFLQQGKYPGKKRGLRSKKSLNWISLLVLLIVFIFGGRGGLLGLFLGISYNNYRGGGFFGTGGLGGGGFGGGGFGGGSFGGGGGGFSGGGASGGW